MKINKKIFLLASVIIFIAGVLLVFYDTRIPPQRNIFDVLTPEDVVGIFFEVKETVLHNHGVEIFPLLSSDTRRHLRTCDASDIRGQGFEFIHFEANILYIDFMSNDSLRVTNIEFSRESGAPIMTHCTTPGRVVTIVFSRCGRRGSIDNLRYEYTLLKEALAKTLGEPQKIFGERSQLENFYWRTDDGMIWLYLLPYGPSILLSFRLLQEQTSSKPNTPPGA